MRSPSLPGSGSGSFWGLRLVLLVQENSVSVVLTLALPLHVLPRRLWDVRGQNHVPQNLGPSSPLETVNWGCFTDGQGERESLGCVHVGRGRFGHGHTGHEKATWTEASSRYWRAAGRDSPAPRARSGHGPWALRKPTQSLPADSGATDPPAGRTSHRPAPPPVCPEPQPSPASGCACWGFPHVPRAASATHRRPGPASAHTRLPCLQSPRDTRTRSSRACCSSSRSGACTPSRAPHTRLRLQETPRTQATVTRRARSGLSAAP